MKRMILVAACATLLASCSTDTRYDYRVVGATPIDDNTEAVMGTISSSDLFGNPVEGGLIMIGPISETADFDPSSPFNSITARDENDDGQWEEIRVCGYARRNDGLPSGCGTMSRTPMGRWVFDPAERDEGHIQTTQAQHLEWVDMANRSRAVLLGLPA